MTYRFFLIPAIWAIIIAFALLIPGGNIPGSEITLQHFDKIVHFFFFAVLSFLVAQALKKQYKNLKWRFKAIELAFILSFVYGFVLEIFQHLFFSGRYFEWLDLLANFTGCLTGLAVFKLIIYKI